MSKNRLGWLSLLAFFLFSLRLTAQEPAAAGKEELDKERIAETKKEARKYLRLKRDDDGQPEALETTVIRYASVSRPGVTVDLIGAVHVGEREYYAELNKRFQGYDALLYELVAPKGAVPQAGRGGGSAIGGLQKMMTKALDLQFQLDGVDYTPKNFVHADMSPREFSETMKQRGESFTQMFFRMMGQGFAAQAGERAGGGNTKLLLALFSQDHTQMKRVMAEQFQEMEATIQVLNGEDGSTIVTERNKKAFTVLRREMDAGKKRLGVFYGAAHLPDMDKRLREQFDFRPVGQQWLQAWRLSTQPDKPAPAKETPPEEKEKPPVGSTRNS